jgi:hypothetical protein
MMNCDELVEQVTEYHEGALGADEVTRIDNHLHVCIGCRMHLGEVDATMRLMSSLPAESMSNELESSLLVMYRDWAESVSR